MHRPYLLCLLFVYVKTQNIYNIENLFDNFVRDEEHLWNTLNGVEDAKKVLNFYEIQMNTNFGEIGIFQMLSKDWLNAYSTPRLIKHFININNTYVQAFELIKNNSYDDISKFAKGLKPLDTIFPICKHISHFF